MEPFEQIYDEKNFRSFGHQIIDELADYFSLVKSKGIPVTSGVNPNSMKEDWSFDFLDRTKVDLISLTRNLIRDSMHLHHPHYMGHQQGVAFPIAALADLLNSALSNSNGVFEMGPVGTMIEKSVIDWMLNVSGIGSNGNGFFTSGGTLGNLTALLAARRQKAPQVWESGETEKLSILVSGEAHYSIDRAIRVMGWGKEGAIKVPVDDNLRMDPSKLFQMKIAAERLGRKVIAVVASACNTASGTFDPISLLSDFCEENNLWLHVDGAHGASTLLSEKYKPLVKGMERADSIVWDAHKMLMMPPIGTAILFKNGNHSFETFTQDASYIFEKPSKEDWFNLGARTFETTKRNLALPLFLSLVTYGPKVFGEIVTTLYDLAREFGELISKEDGFELGAKPESNIVCFKFRNTDISRLRKTLISNGKFYIVQTRLPTGVFLRTTLMNPLTTRGDLKELLQEIRECSSLI